MLISTTVLCADSKVVDDKMTAGDLSAFVIYAMFVGANVGAIAGVISQLIQVGTAWPMPD